ncbi:PREDICTED: uncharacterized protein LOC106750321 isoform X3 [Dinoponera quadriceps]|nr:PREDICTED: uncharacterized protein LOC106750321 isoform X3 [Dinoponera quadriceps]XP_014486071.1 PREDICTED: uncharacterized protein LOC106750321 isoform X3 [Dinoponera quadriceps]XP_014486072.1 PREDICTED: uncharacterized protein LOC106750321 isoform X3 [Dinoponera quadriceps]
MNHAMTCGREKRNKKRRFSVTCCSMVKVYLISTRRGNSGNGGKHTTRPLGELEFTVSSRSFVHSPSTFIMRAILLLVFLASAKLNGCNTEETWEQDRSEDTGASTEGYDRVGLRCGADKMTVELRTTEDFSGVIYTQGSFHSREPSCFLDPVRGRSFTMNIPLNKCDTEKEGEKYSNVVVVQHDDDLVTPGDAAFTLECDFSKPRDRTVTADLNGSKRRPTRSSIALIDADPERDRNKRAAYVESYSDQVVFVPDVAIRKARDANVRQLIKRQSKLREQHGSSTFRCPGSIIGPG